MTHQHPCPLNHEGVWFCTKLWYNSLMNILQKIFKEQIEELRQKYINNPPEGMSKKDIKNMSDDDLLDMDYFLHEDDDIFNNLDDVDVVDFFLFYSFSRSFL